ncbi:hypothetical protein [uncultured Actinomyces sp.]
MSIAKQIIKIIGKRSSHTFCIKLCINFLILPINIIVT